MRTYDAAAVRAAVPMAAAIEAVREAFVDLAAGHFELPQRAALREGAFLVMPVHHRPSATTAVKTLSLSSTRTPRITGSLTWADLENAEGFLADAGAITSLRTGAVAGVAADLFAPPAADRLAVVGAGSMAADQVRAIVAVRPITAVTVVSRTAGNADALARSLSDELGIEVRGSVDVAESVAQADVVCCATPATAPLFAAGDLGPEVHVNAIGSYRPQMRELPDDLLASADVLCVDDRAAVLEESGEVLHALAAGVIAERDLVELGPALAAAVPPCRRGANRLQVGRRRDPGLGDRTPPRGIVPNVSGVTWRRRLGSQVSGPGARNAVRIAVSRSSRCTGTGEYVDSSYWLVASHGTR